MVVQDELTSQLRRLVLDLETDLRERVATLPAVEGRWRREYAEAAEQRTAATWPTWRDSRITQAAVAWVLTTVFVRFCEDNGLVTPVWFTGVSKERQQESLDAELAYVRQHPEHTPREWILQAVAHLQQLPATRGLVGENSPLWTISPSGPAAQRIVDFWRERTPEGRLVRDFTDEQLSTRFLGDLYQDLSESARKTYALLQTPGFVEEFILDQTLTRALAERPLEGLRLIDPTCGSGHFLLGAFDRLDRAWVREAPGLEVQARVQHVLDAIHGVDLNPYAVAIARFRLLVAALQASSLDSLENAPGFTVHLAVGDSLLHGRIGRDRPFDPLDDAEISGFTYTTEDRNQLRAILQPHHYDVVVGNPPYITVSDRRANKAYRRLYDTCHRKYALTVPFMERFFELAKPPKGDQPAGWVGQITSNSFMKREFGSRLIEGFLVNQDLRLVADTSGAYIPGHGTPTVILVGRPQRPVGATVRAVLGVRGEPGQPADPAQGLVWRQIVDHLDDPGVDGDYVSVVDLDRTSLATHPWSLTGGGASTLLSQLDERESQLSEHLDGLIGFASFPGSDESFFGPRVELQRTCGPALTRPVINGEVVRDWSIGDGVHAFWPYDSDLSLIQLDPQSGWFRRQWPLRTILGSTTGFGGETKDTLGEPWWGWYRMLPKRYSTPLSITFAFVATHNHFVLDRGGKVFNRSAPVIKLPAGATEEDHLGLLGVLNSSTACFWLKQNSYPKGGDPIGDSGARVSQQPWSDRYEFTGTTLQDYPLPRSRPVELARLLDATAAGITERFDKVWLATPTAGALAAARTDIERDEGLMVALQEELDWWVYDAYGLLPQDTDRPGDGLILAPTAELPGVALGERAFEIALARQLAAGQEQTAWFARHGSTPVTEIPAHWPAKYQELVRRRLEVIERNPQIRLLERPEYKRRWAREPWDSRVQRRLGDWLLDRLEDRRYWFDRDGRPRPRSVGQLADLVSPDAELREVLELWSGRKDQPVATTLAALLADEAVPFLAAYRLKESGLRKYAQWQDTWALQRREDAGEQVDTIPVPPKYTSADFQPTSWKHRGKLDVPKERFIKYPGAGRDTDPTPLLGWAGWDHAEQFLALVTVITERTSEGWGADRLVPLVAGLAELAPWVRQWHDSIDPAYSLNMADYCDEQLREQAARVGRTADQLAAWRPAARTRGRRRTRTTKDST